MGNPGPCHQPVAGFLGQAPDMGEVMMDKLAVALDHLTIDQDGLYQHGMAGLDNRSDGVVKGLHPPGIGAHEDDVGGLPGGQGAHLFA